MLITIPNLATLTLTVLEIWIIRPVLVPSTGLLVLLDFVCFFLSLFFSFFLVDVCDTLPVTSSTGHRQHLLANVYVHGIFVQWILVQWLLVQSQTDRKRCMRAHFALCTGVLKNLVNRQVCPRYRGYLPSRHNCRWTVTQLYSSNGSKVMTKM